MSKEYIELFGQKIMQKKVLIRISMASFFIGLAIGITYYML